KQRTWSVRESAQYFFIPRGGVHIMLPGGLSLAGGYLIFDGVTVDEQADHPGQVGYVTFFCQEVVIAHDKGNVRMGRGNDGNADDLCFDKDGRCSAFAVAVCCGYRT